MKKIVLTSLMLATALFAGEDSTNYKDLTNMQNHYYEKGYKEASKIYYRLGYEKAIKNSIKALEKYKAQIEAYEAGKYYEKNGKLTYPQMYRVKDGENYVIRIERPELKEKMTYQDIIMIPEFNSDLMADMDAPTPSENEMNAFNLVTPIQEVNSAIAEVRQFEVELPKTDKVKKILSNNGKVYISSPTSYKVIFNDKNDYETFCKTVSGDPQCEKLFLE